MLLNTLYQGPTICMCMVTVGLFTFWTYYPPTPSNCARRSLPYVWLYVGRHFLTCGFVCNLGWGAFPYMWILWVGISLHADFVGGHFPKCGFVWVGISLHVDLCGWAFPFMWILWVGTSLFVFCCRWIFSQLALRYITLLDLSLLYSTFAPSWY